MLVVFFYSYLFLMFLWIRFSYFKEEREKVFGF